MHANLSAWCIACALLVGFGSTGSLSAASQARAAGTATPRTIGLCELLKNIESYRGRIVAVRGVYFHGLRAECRTPFRRGSKTWGSAVEVAHSSRARDDGETVPFETDMESWRRIEDLVMAAAKVGLRGEIWVTIVGFVRAPESYVRKDGGTVQLGYGHLGVFPAEISVHYMKDVEFKCVPTYDYGEIWRAVESRRKIFGP
jgi:hypothetical protein